MRLRAVYGEPEDHGLKHTILQGHVLECLAKIASDSVDTIITSPPYWGLRDYKLEPTVWDAVEGCEHEWQSTQIRRAGRDDVFYGGKEIYSGEVVEARKPIGSNFCSKCSAWKGQFGLEPDFRLYVKHMLQVTKELKRVLKPTGCLWLNLGDTYANSGGAGGDYNEGGLKEGQPKWKQGKASVPAKSLCFVPQRIALAMIDEQDWILRNQIVWYKPNGMPSSVRDRFSNKWEPMFFFVKEPRYWFDLDAVREKHARSSVERAKYPEGQLKKGKGGGFLESGMGQKTGGWSEFLGENGIINDPRGKNPGDFWEVTTQSHPFAHFAVYPDKLVERPIKASCPAEICVSCGKARERITEVKYEKHRPSGSKEGREAIGNKVHDGGFGGWKTFGTNLLARHSTLGWTACSCPSPQYQPGIVLDPFAGSGTTAVVAKSLGRSSISIELNPEYIGIIKKRLDWGHETVDSGIEWA